ncbi:9369_t:CDS:2, partial [Paraglomus occultum]
FASILRFTWIRGDKAAMKAFIAYSLLLTIINWTELQSVVINVTADALHRLSWSLDHTFCEEATKINALYYFYEYAFILFTNQPTQINSYQDLVKRTQIIEQPTEEDMIEEQKEEQNEEQASKESAPST